MLPQVAAQPAIARRYQRRHFAPAETFPLCRAYPASFFSFGCHRPFLTFLVMLSVQLGSGSRGTGFVGRTFGTLFCFAFFAAGIFFFYLIGRDVMRTWGTYRWLPVSCLI